MAAPLQRPTGPQICSPAARYLQGTKDWKLLCGTFEFQREHEGAQSDGFDAVFISKVATNGMFVGSYSLCTPAAWHLPIQWLPSMAPTNRAQMKQRHLNWAIACDKERAVQLGELPLEPQSVFFFTCSDPRYVVYMGKDKYENEELLKYGFPEDIWFHVDKLSSAHVYLRLPPGSLDLSGANKAEAKQRLLDAIASVPEEIMMEMAQLTKENSIEGCKAAQCDIVYTPFLNLKKEDRMEVGQVGFKEESFRTLIKHVAKDKDIVKRLEKTRVEKTVDLAKEKEEHDNEEKARRRKVIEERKKAEKEETKRHLEEKELKSYAALQHLEKSSNVGVSKTGSIEECREIEDDFMPITREVPQMDMTKLARAEYFPIGGRNVVNNNSRSAMVSMGTGSWAGWPAQCSLPSTWSGGLRSFGVACLLVEIHMRALQTWWQEHIPAVHWCTNGAVDVWLNLARGGVPSQVALLKAGAMQPQRVVCGG
ncbi:ccdc25 [Symbiodinium microadriaticum]|nr:ccdc25 [Symbiodinium microadriaticum]